MAEADSKAASPTPDPSSPAKPEPPPAPRPDPVRRLAWKVFVVCAVIFIWYLFADRYTPITHWARIKMPLVALAPRVSGYVTEVRVALRDKVKKGQVLFQLDRHPYELALKQAQAELDSVTQQVAALGATVKSAAARVGVAKAQLDRAQRNYHRTQTILKQNPGALSQADRDLAETSLAQALERVASAEADLEKAQQQLGVSGDKNAQVRAAAVAVAQAQFDLESTEIQAPLDGVIENLYLDVGQYAAAGQPLAVLVTSRAVWVEAYMRENNLTHLAPGKPVDLVLDVYPGHVLKGRIRCLGAGASTGAGSSPGNLPAIPKAKGWLRDPQRFPVEVELADLEPVRDLLRSGGQATVIAYAGSNPVLNFIGRIEIRISSWLSYVR